MAFNSSLPHTAANALGRKKYVQTVTFTTAGGNDTLSATFADGTAIPAGVLWVFQPDADVNYDLGNAANGSISLTNSVWVQAGQQEACGSYVTDGTLPDGTRPILSHIGRSGSGNIMVFAVP